MKTIINLKYIEFRLKIFVVMCACLGIIPNVFSQVGEQATPNTTETTSDSTAAEEEVEGKPELRMSFEVFKINDRVKILARVRSKVDTKWHNTAGVEVSFYKDEAIDENLIGKDTSNSKGETTWLLPVQQQSVTYVASVKDNPDYEDVEESITVNPSVLTLELVEEDSIRYVKSFIGVPNDSGQVVGVPEVECKIFVQRLFGNMPIGEPETTDEEGNITVEFPAGIPGDTAGQIFVVAKVAEHEILGNVETSKEVKWGVPVVSEDFYSKRQLWSARANAPIALVVLVNLALLGIWGVIFYIFREIFRINKIGRSDKINKAID